MISSRQNKKRNSRRSPTATSTKQNSTGSTPPATLVNTLSAASATAVREGRKYASESRRLIYRELYLLLITSFYYFASPWKKCFHNFCMEKYLLRDGTSWSIQYFEDQTCIATEKLIPLVSHQEATRNCEGYVYQSHRIDLICFA